MALRPEQTRMILEHFSSLWESKVVRKYSKVYQSVAFYDFNEIIVN